MRIDHGFRALAGCLALLGTSSANGQFDVRLIEDVLITQWDTCAFIHVRFGVPIKYTGHTPQHNQQQLHIEFETIATKPYDWETVFERRAIELPAQQAIPLIELIYEKNFDGHRTLIFSFSRPMNLTTGQGKDLNRLAISIAEQNASPCPPP